jgi:hypothetical protein
MTWRAALVAFAAYTAVAIAVTFPLVLHLSGALPHDLGDPLLSTAILWWNAHAVPFTERWWNGFAFYPAPGMLTFSDHRLGASLIASPIQWLGGSEIIAYNVTLLLTFPLSALAAHALGFTLTRRHDAAAICGLAYGFSPYRIAHVEHLELLVAYGMPLALMALHRFAETRRARWMVLFGTALVLQGLSTSYFLLFFCVLLGLWMLWFVDWRDWRFVVAVIVAGLAAAAVLSPVILGYLRIHGDYAMVRGLREVLEYSGELSSFVAASPLLSLWGWTNGLAGSERQLFPGLAVTLLAAAGAVLAVRRRPATPAGVPRLTIAFAMLTLGTIAVVISVRMVGPWQVGPLRVSADVFKPQSVALAFLALTIAAWPGTRAAFRRKSALAFYLFACVFLFLCSLGPKPTYLGAQVLYEPPYAWLMRLPVFGSAIRAPARFAMPAILALSAAAAIGFARLTAGNRHLRRAAVVVACGAIVADTWMGGLPMVALRSNWSPAWAATASSVLELPLGTVMTDVAAMYRTTGHRLPVVNGYSGFSPPHYAVLRRALSEGDGTILPQVAATGPVLVAVDRRADRDRRLQDLAAGVPGARQLGLEGRWMFFQLPGTGQPGTTLRETAAGPGCSGSIGLAAIAESAAPEGAAGVPNDGQAGVRKLIDGDEESAWISPGPQHAGHAITVTMAREARVCSLTLLLGGGPEVYPGAMAIELSRDGIQWESVFEGQTGGLAMAGALRDPVRSPITFEWDGRPARLLRIRLVASHVLYPWAMREIIVRGDG